MTLEQYINEVNRLVREMDVLLNGEKGAAQQASLCDMVAQIMSMKAANLIRPNPLSLLGMIDQFMDVDGQWKDCSRSEVRFYVEGDYAMRKLFIYTNAQ